MGSEKLIAISWFPFFETSIAVILKLLLPIIAISLSPFEEELIDFKQKNNQISITTSSSDKKNNRILKSKFLLACDGVDSFVRTRLNIDQMDLQYNKDWLIIDIKLNKGITLDKVARQICDPNRPTVFMHAPEGRHRFEFQLLAGEDSIEMKSNKNLYLYFDF